MLVSGVEKSDSVIHISFLRVFSHTGYYKLWSKVSCALWEVPVDYFINSSVKCYLKPPYLSLPNTFSNHKLVFYICESFCFVVTQSWPTLCKPMSCSTPGFPLLHYLPEFAQTHVHWVDDATNHLIFCLPLLLPSIFPSIRSFPMSNQVLELQHQAFRWIFRFDFL